MQSIERGFAQCDIQIIRIDIAFGKCRTNFIECKCHTTSYFLRLTTFDAVCFYTDQIKFYSQETYLNATLAFLAKVIETGRFMELIENRKETKDIGRFVTSEMSTILNKVSLESVYARAREIFKLQQRGSYAQV